MNIGPTESPAAENSSLLRLAGLYIDLTKPRLSALTVVTAIAGFIAARTTPAWPGALHVALGTALSAGGAAVLNQVMERAHDSRMDRTKNRPLPSGILPPAGAAGWGFLLSIAGIGHLLYWCNLSSGLLAAVTVLLYTAVYTPLKRLSKTSLEVGAVAGALPPLIGWAAADHTVSGAGWLLFAILFTWQIPHFLAISWIYRKDYAAAGFPMLTVLDETGNRAARQAVRFSIILFLITLIPPIAGYTTIWYLLGAVPASLWFLLKTIRFQHSINRDAAARRLFFASLLHLPILLGLLVFDRAFLL